MRGKVEGNGCRVAPFVGIYSHSSFSSLFGRMEKVEGFIIDGLYELFFSIIIAKVF